jgi:hypothetical protein
MLTSFGKYAAAALALAARQARPNAARACRSVQAGPDAFSEIWQHSGNTLVLKRNFPC